MSGFQITEIIAVGPGWNRVRLSDGNIYTIEGNYNWRSNNPGNIEYGQFAQSMGAIGSGAVPEGRQRGFAIFPTYEDGRRAKEALLFEGNSYLNAKRGGYEKGSIGSAIHRYAPPTENDTEGYIRAITSALGVTPNTKLSELSPAQRSAMLDTMERVEGWKVGDIRTADGIRLPPAEIPNVVASQLDTQINPNAPLPIQRGEFDASRNLTDPRTGQLYQGVEPPQPAMRQGLLDMLKEGPPLRVRLPELPPAAPIVAPVPADRPEGLPSYLAGPNAPEATAAPRSPLLDNPAATTVAADVGLTQRNPVTPVITPENDNMYSYWIPDVTPASIVGGVGSLTPDFFNNRTAPAAQPSASPGPARTVTPAQMLIAGSGAPWSAADGPAVRPRPQPTPTQAPTGLGSAAPQQGLGNVANVGGQLIESATPGFYRIAGINGGAGSVAMPADARPNVTIPDMPPAERRPDQNHPLIMPKFQELQDFFGIEPKADYPNPIRSVADMEATQRKPTLSQPLSPNQGTTFAGQERGPTFKTVMKEERIENPEYKVWQANQTALTSSVPLGERTFSTSRDSKDARLAGEAFAANNMPERWITRQVPTRVPVAQPATKPVAPAAPPPAAVTAVVPLAGTPQAQPRGLFDMLAPTSGPLAAILGLSQRQPVQVAQGHVGGGSHAFAVGPNGISAVTLNSGGNSAFDAANHGGQNMDVYRANREAIGGPITQSSISAAQSSGKTLFRG